MSLPVPLPCPCPAQSALTALAAELKYAEDVLARSCSVENVGTKDIIDGAKALAEQLNINKAQAKSLFTAGKDVSSSAHSEMRV